MNKVLKVSTGLISDVTSTECIELEIVEKFGDTNSLFFDSVLTSLLFNNDCSLSSLLRKLFCLLSEGLSSLSLSLLLTKTFLLVECSSPRLFFSISEVDNDLLFFDFMLSELKILSSSLDSNWQYPLSTAKIACFKSFIKLLFNM